MAAPFLRIARIYGQSSERARAATSCKALPVTDHLATVVLVAVAAAELVALAVVGALLVRSRRHVAELEQRLTATQRTGPLSAAERAMKAVVGTAVRVRDQGVGGLLMSSLEDLTRWAKEDRAQIVRVAAPDGTVTVFFSDIEDSTSMNEQLGDAEWMRVLDAHDKVVRSQVSRHGGHVVKTQGDGFMVVFGEPAAAVQAAVGIQTALTTGPGRRLRRAPVKVRIGIHVGAVVSRDGDYFGRNVAMAARVAAQAGGGEILISDAVRSALGEQDEFVLERGREVELKGLGEAHLLWMVKWSD
jgi:adenylate cyclase